MNEYVHFVDIILILLKKRHNQKVMTETISTPSEDLKSCTFMHHDKSNFDKVKIIVG